MTLKLIRSSLVRGALAAGFTFAMLCSSSAEAAVIQVTTTIQAAVDAAQPGDTIEVPKGVYQENVLVTKAGITITGKANAVLDGEGLDGSTGITVSSGTPGVRIDGFTLDGMTIRNYSANGVLVVAADNFEILNGIYEDNVEYGIFPVYTAHGRVAFNRASGSETPVSTSARATTSSWRGTVRRTTRSGSRSRTART